MSDSRTIELEKKNSYCSCLENKVENHNSIDQPTVRTKENYCNTNNTFGEQETAHVKQKSSLLANKNKPCQNSLVSSSLEFENSVNKSVVQETPKTYPVNQAEALHILQRKLRETAKEIFGADTNMFDYITWIAMACGLKYVHECSKTNINQNNQTQNEKFNMSIANQDKRLDDGLRRLEKDMDKSIANIKDRVAQNQKFDDLVKTLEQGFQQKIAGISASFFNKNGRVEDIRLLELQNQLLTQILDTLNEEKKVSKSKDDAYHKEQELALKAAMDRYSERVKQNLPKYLACQYQQLQDATLKFQSYLKKESKNITELPRSHEDVEKVIAKLQVESDGFGKKLLEVIKPSMKLMEPWICRLRF